jgi:hypothetical protein
MSFNSFVEYNNVYPILLPVDLGTTDTATPYVALNGAHSVGFLVMFGVTTENATTDIIDVTVEAATIESGTEAAITFNYRLSSAVTANTWGALTAATTTGAELNKNHEGMSLWIEVDPQALAANDYRFLRVKATINAFTVCLYSVVAFLEPRYALYTMKTATACASV